MQEKLAPISKGLEDRAFRDIPKFLAGKPLTYRKIPLPATATIGEVKAARHTLHATQRRFAQIIGVSVETVRAWEMGRRKPEGIASKVIRLMRKDATFARVFEAI